MHVFADILRSNKEKLKKYLEQNGIEAYRLYYMDDRRWPVALDVYGNEAVIHYFGSMSSETRQDMERSITEVVHVKKIFSKDRTKERANAADNKEHTGQSETVVHEYGHTFFVNLSDYLDTGLFLDHRETRKWIEGLSKGKIVLNTFAYTGSFSVYAAAGGAAKTYSVDLSKTYCDWIKRNMDLNNLPAEQNWIYKMDTLEFFKYAKRKGMSFDIIILDPPTFSRNKGKNFSVQKDHPELINAALEILSEKGFILFSNNCRDFEMSPEKINSKNVSEKRDTIPPDFMTGKQSPRIHRTYIIGH